MVNIQLNILKTCSSTNDIAKQEAVKGLPEGSSFLSYFQTHGRGRNKNKWESLEGNLFLSSILRPKQNKIYWHQLSLLIGYSLIQILIDFGVNKNIIELKWPNDVLVKNKKISGILLEAFENFIVVGIGLNILKNPLAENKWETTKLNDYVKNKMSLEQISFKILKKFYLNYSIWEELGFIYFKEKINNYIKNKGKTIIVKLNSTSDAKKAVFLGIGESGSLKVRIKSNISEYYSIEHFTFIDDELL